MTVRNTKRLIVVLVALLVLLPAANLFLSLRGGGHDLPYFELMMPLFLVIAFAGTWRRLSKLEAEHGPDFVQPAPPNARKLLIGAGIVAAVLGAVAGYLIATR